MTELRYKLLTPELKTRAGEANETQWQIGEWVEAKGKGGLCSGGVLHFYPSPEVAAFMNPIHANICNPVFAELEVDAIVEETATKGGARRARITRILPSIVPTLVQRVAFGVLCAKAVSNDKRFNSWADKWLSGEDRSYEAAAERAAELAAELAAEVEMARVVAVDRAAAWAAAWAAAARVAEYAAVAVDRAARANIGMDLTLFAKQALAEY